MRHNGILHPVIAVAANVVLEKINRFVSERKTVRNLQKILTSKVKLEILWKRKENSIDGIT